MKIIFKKRKKSWKKFDTERKWKQENKGRKNPRNEGKKINESPTRIKKKMMNKRKENKKRKMNEKRTNEKRKRMNGCKANNKRE